MMISGLRWILSTIASAAGAEQEDDTALREALLDAGMRHERGELSDAEFARTEDEILSRIRAIRRRSPAPGSIALAGSAPGRSLEVEASLEGDFHGPSPGRAPPAPPRTRARGGARKP